MKKTPWFPADIKPVHVGVYETKHEVRPGAPESCFRYWDGKWWSLGARPPAMAHWLRGAFTELVSEFNVVDEWRGLADKPKE